MKINLQCLGSSILVAAICYSAPVAAQNKSSNNTVQVACTDSKGNRLPNCLGKTNPPPIKGNLIPSDYIFGFLQRIASRTEFRLDFQYPATSGLLFTRILNLPAGFDRPFKILVNGRVIGQFRPGQTVDFTQFNRRGVSGFTIIGVAPSGDLPESASFSLKLESKRVN